MTLKAMVDPAFAPRELVYLPLAAAGLIPITNTTKAHIISSNYTPHQVELVVEADEPSLIVLSQAHHHPWTATVNEVPTRIWIANHAFQAVLVPVGRHQVAFRYRDPSFAVGACLTFRTLLGLGYSGFKRRLARSPAPLPSSIVPTVALHRIS
jgi:hypothetical protein